jgi:ribosomal protein S24E
MGEVGESMTVKIVEERKNPLLKREEIICIFEHPDKATPSRKEMLPLFESTLKTEKDLIIIDKIFSVKGKGESKVHVFTYKKKEDMPKEKLEKMQRRAEKKGGGEKKPPEEAEKEEEGKG